MCLGTCILVAWVICAIARPRRLSLGATPGRTNSLNPAHLVALLALSMLAARLLVKISAMLLGSESDQAYILLTVGNQLIWLAGCLLVARLTFRLKIIRGLGLSVRHWIFDSGRGLLGYLAVLPLCIGLQWLAAWLAVQLGLPAPAEHEMLVRLTEAPLPWRVLAIISAVVLASISEEVFFRGLLQSMLRRYLARPWWAIVIASGIFAMMHYPYGHAMPTLFVLALVLGYSYERSGRLVASILIHALFNAASIWIYLAARGA